MLLTLLLLLLMLGLLMDGLKRALLPLRLMLRVVRLLAVLSGAE